MSTEQKPTLKNFAGNSKTIHAKAAMLKALQNNRCIVTKAADEAKLDRSHHYEWMRTDPEYKAAVTSLDDLVLDFAEGKLHDLIDKGDTASTIFFLKTKGKKRGYVERTENLIGEFLEQPLYTDEEE